MGPKKDIGNHLPSLSYDKALKEAGTPLFHIARTHVTRFLMLPSATRITHLTSY